jgi:hypothetical protein
MPGEIVDQRETQVQKEEQIVKTILALTFVALLTFVGMTSGASRRQNPISFAGGVDDGANFDWSSMTFTITGGEAVMMGVYGVCSPSDPSGEPSGEPGPATTVFFHIGMRVRQLDYPPRE